MGATAFGVAGLAFVGYVGSSQLHSPKPLELSEAASVLEAQNTGVVVVHVTGAVERPGVLELPSGSRINDAILAAGGPIDGANLSALNLAAPVQDGQQILVPDSEAAVPQPTPATAGSSVPMNSPERIASGGPTNTVGRISLNSATQAQLEQIRGIGPVLAQRIISFRNQIGGFRSIEQLEQVKGIGPKKMQELRPQVTL